MHILTWCDDPFNGRIELKFGVLVFVEGGKPENLVKKTPLEQGENQNKYDTRPDLSHTREWDGWEMMADSLWLSIASLC